MHGLATLAALAALSLSAPPEKSPPHSQGVRDDKVVTFTQNDEVDVERLEPTAEVWEQIVERQKASLVRLRWSYAPELVRSADSL